MAQRRAEAKARRPDKPPGDGKEGQVFRSRGPLLREISRDPDGTARDVRRNQEEGAGRAHEGITCACKSVTVGPVGLTAQGGP